MEKYIEFIPIDPIDQVESISIKPIPTAKLMKKIEEFVKKPIIVYSSAGSDNEYLVILLLVPNDGVMKTNSGRSGIVNIINSIHRTNKAFVLKIIHKLTNKQIQKTYTSYSSFIYEIDKYVIDDQYDIKMDNDNNNDNYIIFLFLRKLCLCMELD